MKQPYFITPPHNHDEVYAKIGESGVTDHGLLTGLEDNDHPQYLLTTGKAADSDKLDGVDSSGFVNMSSAQTVGGTKTFSSIPVLPSTNPTLANQAIRKGYADATYRLASTAIDHGSLTGLGDNDHPQYRLSNSVKMTPIPSMADDTATSIIPTNSQGILFLRTVGGDVMAAVFYDAISPTAYCALLTGTTTVEVRTGVLSGTTGTDGKFTISAHTDGKIYLENRRGFTLYPGYIAL